MRFSHTLTFCPPPTLFRYYIPFRTVDKLPDEAPQFQMRPVKTIGPASSTLQKNDFRSHAHLSAVKNTLKGKFPNFDKRAKERCYFRPDFEGTLGSNPRMVSTSRHTIRVCGVKEGVIGPRAPCPHFVAGSLDLPVSELAALDNLKWVDPNDPVLPPLPDGNPFKKAAAALVPREGNTGTWLIGDVLQQLCGKDLSAELRRRVLHPCAATTYQPC